MNCANCHLKSDALVKDANDVAIGATLATKLANEFAVSFEFGAR
jgi:hypothetical protein